MESVTDHDDVMESGTRDVSDAIPVKRRPGRPLGSKNKFQVKGHGNLSRFDGANPNLNALRGRGCTVNIASGSLGLRRNVGAPGKLHHRKILRRGVCPRIPRNLASGAGASAKVQRSRDNTLCADNNFTSNHKVPSDPKWMEKELVITDVTTPSGTITFTECRDPDFFFKRKIS